MIAFDYRKFPRLLETPGPTMLFCASELISGLARFSLKCERERAVFVITQQRSDSGTEGPLFTEIMFGERPAAQAG
jgi:hypothetical protein